VVSQDLDTDSVACCQKLHEQENQPDNWQVMHLSVLDQEGIAALGQFDVVYSFGVLHHTGHMWTAIENAMQLVKPGGHFYLTIYNKKRGRRGSRYWLRWKKFYVSSPGFIQKMLQGWQWFYFFQGKLLGLKNPFRILREFKKKRGMSWKHDMIDWIGGYPYEFATSEELFHGVQQRGPDFQLVNLKDTVGLGTNWLLFQRGQIVTPAPEPHSS